MHRTLSVFLLLLLIAAWHSALAADNAMPIVLFNKTAAPLVMKLSIDPAGAGKDKICAEDGMIHVRGGKLLICVGTAWRDVVLHM